MKRFLTVFALGSVLATTGSAFAAPEDLSSSVGTAITDGTAGSDFTTELNRSRQVVEVTRVAEGAIPRTGILDARVERFYNTRIPSNTTDDYEFSGFFTIDSARDTTVFQLLNRDRRVTDVLRPTLFLEATRFENSRGEDILVIHDGRRGEGAPQIRFQRNDNNFHLRVKVVDGTTAEVYIDGRRRYVKTLDRDEGVAGAQYGEDTQVRYGAYHHHTRVIGPPTARTKEALSEARIRILNPRFRRL